MKSFGSTLFLFLFVYCLYAQEITTAPDPVQFPKGYPGPAQGALKQLSNYPLPRYAAGHHLARLFDWMNPLFLAGAGQPETDPYSVPAASALIQRELALNWHYGIVIPNSGSFTGCDDVIRLANEFPDISLDLITFWMAVSPAAAGYPYQHSMIVSQNLDSSLYINFDFYGNPSRQIKFNFPDSLIQMDGAAQARCIKTILSCLKRPINRINEDGEEPPGPFLLRAIKKDPAMKSLKESMKIASWEDFMATRKLHMRNVYSSSFMKMPELHNTQFNFYTVEGGPVDRFRWPIMKKALTPVNGIYYSTPDFYPRWPSNWKNWKGPWHGWRWIEIGRQTEIRDGDYLFSPFVAAGWSNKQEEDIRPGQWLGLLKCLGTIGAEYYHVGYFSLSAPFTKPGTFVWQAAMPAYAQAITSRYEDVLKNGNVLSDAQGQPIITYLTDDPHVLVTARKHKQKDKYVICGTYQPFSNGKDEIPEKTNATVEIDGKMFSFEVRRQGSVYIYEEQAGHPLVFYQLDGWHENAHPDYWSHDLLLEAELSDAGETTGIRTESPGALRDYRKFVSFIRLVPGKEYAYSCALRDSLQPGNFVWMRYRGKGNLSCSIGGEKQSQELPAVKSWTWARITKPFPSPGLNGMLRIQSGSGEIEIDKMLITHSATLPVRESD